jgi:hypothetical protein
MSNNIASMTFLWMQKVKNNDMSAMDVAHIWNAGALMILLCTTFFVTK